MVVVVAAATRRFESLLLGEAVVVVARVVRRSHVASLRSHAVSSVNGGMDSYGAMLRILES